MTDSRPPAPARSAKAVEAHVLGCACAECRDFAPYISRGYVLGRKYALGELRRNLSALEKRGYVIPSIVFTEIDHTDAD